jgi:hypothetical protein
MLLYGWLNENISSNSHMFACIKSVICFPCYFFKLVRKKVCSGREVNIEESDIIEAIETLVTEV